MWFSVAARLGKKLVRGAWNSSRERVRIAWCRRWFASRLACAWVTRKSRSCIAAPVSSKIAVRGRLERAALEPPLDLRPPVVAPERLAVDDEEGRAEHAVGDRVVADLAQLGLRLGRGPDRLGLGRVEAELGGERLQ